MLLRNVGWHSTDCFHAGFLLSLFFRPWRWRRYVPPKHRLTFKGLHGVISQKLVLFIEIIITILLIQYGIPLREHKKSESCYRGLCCRIYEYLLIGHVWIIYVYLYLFNPIQIGGGGRWSYCPFELLNMGSCIQILCACGCVFFCVVLCSQTLHRAGLPSGESFWMSKEDLYFQKLLLNCYRPEVKFVKAVGEKYLSKIFLNG
jgi:hypothetical protein